MIHINANAIVRDVFEESTPQISNSVSHSASNSRQCSVNESINFNVLSLPVETHADMETGSSDSELFIVEPVWISPLQTIKGSS